MSTITKNSLQLSHQQLQNISKIYHQVIKIINLAGKFEKIKKRKRDKKILNESLFLKKEFENSKTLVDAINLSQEYKDTVNLEAPCKGEYEREARRRDRKILKGNIVNILFDNKI